jgi:pimeloyl-ACP methyl ester carboxylesterase
VVVSHSFGGLPAMLAATWEPDAFAALGLYEPAMSWLDWWTKSTRDYHREVAESKDPGALAEQLARSILGDEGWDALTDEGRAQRRAEGRAFQIDTASQLKAPFDDITPPTVVGYGTASLEDRIIGGPWLADRLPDGQVYAIEGADHWAQRGKPAGFAEFVRAVIARSDDRDKSAVD